MLRPVIINRSAFCQVRRSRLTGGQSVGRVVPPTTAGPSYTHDPSSIRRPAPTCVAQVARRSRRKRVQKGQVASMQVRALPRVATGPRRCALALQHARPPASALHTHLAIVGPAAHGANACAVSLPLIPRHRCLWPKCEASCWPGRCTLALQHARPSTRGPTRASPLPHSLLTAQTFAP